ncbi:BT4734/BF3469 family protein [Flavobacterium sandaracinum]|uniref:BT4734-like N-terminal domain-containing protein n=1 Tax=Flavobacterium sandaracinum TaxID=2541733 RepID=A0A4V2Z0Y3_9FLAO|nr:BT4734/BF3469 family protein [Flavobacterium sandaracinum]TDE02728.1 hypothetical protein E0F91_12005 [Flavobacterium sandaracinum]
MASTSNQTPQKSKDNKVSLFIGGIKTVKSQKTISIDEVVSISASLQELTAKMIACNNPAEKQKLKLLQPFITPYGTFSYRENKSILHYNRNIAAFDFDKLTTEQTEALKAILVKNASVLLCFISGSQHGVKAIILLSEVINLDKHYNTLKVNAAALLDAIGATEYAPFLDVAQFKLSQPMFLSYDANLHFNTDATPLAIQLIEPIEIINEPQPVRELKNYDAATQIRIEAYANNAVDRLCFELENHDGARHPQIANVKGIAGLYKGYNLENEQQAYDRLESKIVAMYGTDSEAKAGNAFNSMRTAWNDAEPLRNATIEEIIKESTDYFASEHEINRLKYRIDVTEEIPAPQIAWSLLNVTDGKPAILGTLGNFSLVIGKAKAKKSFFINIAVSTALSDCVMLERFTSDLPIEQNEVIYFDTEQGKYHVQAAIKRICDQINQPEPKNLHAYFLRSLTPSERLKFIEEEIYSNPRIGFVVIDGIKDLVTSINDEEQATNVASKLLKWTEERNIHIVTVLHQNKSDANARGHIGTELINKAETVLEVAKSDTEPKISIVTALQCRNIEAEPFAFEIDVFGLPIAAEHFEQRTETKNNRFDVSDLEEVKKYELLQEVFSNGQSFTYTDLVIQLGLAYKSMFNTSIGTNRAKELLTYSKNRGWLIKGNSTRSPYLLGVFAVADEI